MKDQHTTNHRDAAGRNTCTTVGAWLPPLEVMTSASHRTDGSSASMPMRVAAGGDVAALFACLGINPSVTGDAVVDGVLVDPMAAILALAFGATPSPAHVDTAHVHVEVVGAESDSDS